MSERRVPRFEDDYCAELPTWPPRKVSPQGAYPAPTAVPSVRSLAGGTAFSSDDAAPTSTTRREKAGDAASPAPAFALSEPALVLLRLIGAYHGESDTAALLRAVAHYADAIGIHVLARPIPPCEAGEGDHAQRGGGGAPPSSGFAVHSPRKRGEIHGADAQAPP